MSIAYRDYNRAEFETMLEQNENFEREEDRAIIENELCVAASFSLSDPYSDDIHQIISKLKEAKMNVRMITGDQKETAVAVATELSIVDDPSNDEAIRSGDEITEYLSMFMVKENGEYSIKPGSSEKNFLEDISNSITVVYRCTPEQKYMITSAFRLTNDICAVTGRSSSDTLALSASNVGFAMGISGCSAAKDASKVIVIDDNFQSVFNAAKWGRNLFDNCRKFIQF